MSSQKTTRSPKPSPTEDLEQSFFRVLAFRSFDQHNPIISSEASSPISPMTQRTARKRPPLKSQSEASYLFRNSPIYESTASSSSIRVSEVISGEPPLLKVTKPSEAGRSNSNDSRSSSISTHARNLLKGSWSRSASASTLETKLLQATKIGCSKKRESSTHRLDIRIRRKVKSDGQGRADSEDTSFDVPYATPVQNTPRTSEANPKGNSVHLATSLRHDEPALLEPIQKGGFYCRAKRRLALGQESSHSTYEDHGTKTFTGELLERATTMLRDVSDKMMTTPSSTTSGSNQSSRSYFGWHTHSARLIPFYFSIRASSSSSIHNARMGNAPQASPIQQTMYIGSDSKQYPRVELTNPDGPSYLPSEARRVNTPPSPKTMSGKHLRGFFFDYNAPYERTPSPDAVEGHPLDSSERRKQRSSGVDWYRVKLAADEAKDEQLSFELNVPEHLPNSPLCPKNPKHRSGGKGVCVYHGRNKAIPVEK